VDLSNKEYPKVEHWFNMHNMCTKECTVAGFTNPPCLRSAIESDKENLLQFPDLNCQLTTTEVLIDRSRQKNKAARLVPNVARPMFMPFVPCMMMMQP
jgi:hypothetical protein